jgi:predicted extracellular nuclease
VVATSVDFGDEESTFYVQDPATGAGVAVFTKGALFDVEVGDVLDLTGGVQEFYDLTEVVVTDLSTLTRTGSATPVATELSAAPSDWEPYEGQLLTLLDVEVTSEASYGQVATNYAGLFVDDLFVRFTSTPGTTWSSVTGVLHYSYGEWKLEPRTLDDLRSN